MASTINEASSQDRGLQLVFGRHLHMCTAHQLVLTVLLAMETNQIGRPESPASNQIGSHQAMDMIQIRRPATICKLPHRKASNHQRTVRSGGWQRTTATAAARSGGNTREEWHPTVQPPGDLESAERTTRAATKPNQYWPLVWSSHRIFSRPIFISR